MSDTTIRDIAYLMRHGATLRDAHQLPPEQRRALATELARQNVDGPRTDTRLLLEESPVRVVEGPAQPATIDLPAGAAAFLAGHPLESNPHQPGTPASAEWRMSWRSAKATKEAT